MLLPGRQEAAAEHERRGGLPKGDGHTAEMGPEGSERRQNTGGAPDVLAGARKVSTQLLSARTPTTANKAAAHLTLQFVRPTIWRS